MKNTNFSFIISLALLLVMMNNALSQQPAKGVFVEPKNEYWDLIKKTVEDFEKKPDTKKKPFKADFSTINLPKTTTEFAQIWHQPPISQGWTGTCWGFSGTSFFESEIKRINGAEIKLSELYTVYWEYAEKARRFIRERGNSAFPEGSQLNSTVHIFKQYGCIPAEFYTGMKAGQTFHSHEKMHGEMLAFLNSLKTANFWNEDVALATIKNIMNHYIGAPPETVTIGGKKYTPQEYLRTVAKLNPDDYIEFMSLLEKPYNSKAEYEVTDNWRKYAEYYNVSLDDFMNIIKTSVKKGFSIAIGGDVSEPGYDGYAEVAVVPAFDIPSEFIDENARQFRFSNGSTTDDHAIHIVGWKEKDGKMWFLIKDSGSGSRNGQNKGYYFYHEDYIKLKMMTIMIHRSAVQDVLKKFN